MSIGELKKDAGNNCMPVIINGDYTSNKTINDSNFLLVTAQVTLPGTYTIYTDTVNGYSFQATGNFKTKGPIQVQLAGNGKPDTAGTNHFSIYYNESICQASITVKSDALPPAPPAVYTFQDAAARCLEDSVNGAFVKGIPLNASSGVTATINVTGTGSFNIVTDTVNGYWFSAKGEFTTIGIQTVVLIPSGTPVKGETDVFSLQSNSANAVCNFSVAVYASVVPVTNSDLLPLAINNIWVYDDLVSPGDSVVRTINETTVKDGNTYFVTSEKRKDGVGQYLFRKAAAPYYEYALADKYTSSFKYSRDIDTNLMFLNEILTTGSYWESAEIKDVASFGQEIFLKYTYYCTEANTVVVINGKVFGNVYKINMLPVIKSEYAGYGSTNEYYTFYYAKGIGLIYFKMYDLYYVEREMQIRSWQVN